MNKLYKLLNEYSDKEWELEKIDTFFGNEQKLVKAITQKNITKK